MQRRAIFLLTCAMGLAGSVALAQSNQGPAELPPAGFDGNQFVDSSGCAFVRATVNGVASWIPRVDQDRNPICSFEPTFAEVETDATEEPAAETVEAEVAEEQIEAAEAETLDVNEQADAVESETAEAPAPTEAMTATPASRPAPRVAASRTAAPASTPVPAPQPVAAPRSPVTRAQACAGRAGVQTGFISLSTGQPIDCGPVANMDTSGDVPRLTTAEICARMANTNVRYINAATGEPIQCASAAPTHSSGSVVASSGVLDRPYIQVGSFAVPSNAERLIARLGDMGLPVASGRSRGLRIVAAGPFNNSAAQQRALSAVRDLGFHDAFLRN